MGNLREKYTDEEWEAKVDKIKEDKLNGKPETELYLNLSSKEIYTLRNLKEILSEFYYPHELSLLDKWIDWKQK